MSAIDDMVGLATVVVGAGVVSKIASGFFPDPRPLTTKSGRRTRKSTKRSPRRIKHPGNFSNIGF